MLLNKVEIIFRMLSLNQAYVTNSGKLVGIINRATLREFLGKYSKRPIDKCLLLFRSMSACFCCGWDTMTGGKKRNKAVGVEGDEVGSIEEMTPLHTPHRQDGTASNRSSYQAMEEV